MAGIYIHIPFCRQACVYCNFHFSTSLARKEDMLQALAREVAMQKAHASYNSLQSIYIGGGTPSLLTAEEIKRLTDTVAKHFDLTNLLEFTLETNPDDLSRDYIHSLRYTPVNRFSIGVQSFYDHDLRYMNRAHNAQQADYAIKASQDAGFTNLTIDLIYGTPGLTDTNWLHNLHKVEELGIPHFSAYALTVEEKTALYHNILHNKSAPVDAEQSAAQFEILMDTAAEMGFEHYEISNLARTGHRAIHNTNYWLGIPYIGIGPSAHTYNGSTRRWNIANNALYLKSILTEGKIPYEEEILTPAQRLNEYIMTSLRTSWGTDLAKVAAEWHSDYKKELLEKALPFIESGQIIQHDDTLVLTRKGKLFADHIAGDLFF